MILTESTTLAAVCDWEGNIKEVVSDDLGLGNLFAIGKPFLTIVDQASKNKAFHFLAMLKLKGSVSDWELNITSNKGIQSLYFTGGALNQTLLIIGTPSRDDATRFYDELVRANNEQVNALRSALKEQHLLKRDQRRQESQYYEELTRLNNELTTMQRELVKKNVQLERLNEQKNQLLGMAAHDLRNPLSGIMSFSEFLLAEEEEALPAEERREFLHIIHESSQFMLRIVNDLLDFSAIDAGKLNLRLEETDLAALIQRNVDLNRIVAQQKGIRVLFSKQSTIPPVVIDRTKIEQVLNNLISNAIKYSYPGSQIEISLREQDNQVHIGVKDEGQGIPASELNQLFKPFQKTSVQSTAGESSTGLGLAIVKKIIAGHQGEITVESEVGQGSTFYVYLPIKS